MKKVLVYLCQFYYYLRRAFPHYLRRAFSDFKVAFWNWGALIIPTYLAFAGPLTWLLGHQSLDYWTLTPLYYLLSAQVQVLGTIIALVFTATFVVAQLASRYSQRILRQVLGPWAFYYFIPYLAGIALPLFLLNSNFSLWAVRVSLLLGGFCLVLLIPYFVALRNRLSLNIVIQEMKGEKALSDLQSFALGAYESRDYETFERAIEALQMVGEDLMDKSGEQGALVQDEGTQEEKTLDSLRNGLVEIARWTFGHPRAPFVIVGVLRELGIKAVNDRQGSPALKFIGALGKIGLDALRRDIPDLAGYAAGAIGWVAEQAVNSQLWEVVRGEQGTLTVKMLISIGQNAAKMSVDGVVERVSSALRRVAVAAIEFAASQTADARKGQDVAIKLSKAMGQVGCEAVGRVSDDEVLKIVGHLWHSERSVGAEAIQTNQGPVVRQVIESLKQIDDKARQEDQPRVLKSVIIALGELVTKLYQGESYAENQYRERRRVPMKDWRKQCIDRAVSYLCESAKNAAQLIMRIDAAQQEEWEYIGTVAQNLGFAGQNALQAGDHDNAERCFNALKIIAKCVLEVSEHGKFPREQWRKEKVGWYVATSLGYIAERAASRRLEGLTQEAIDLLVNVGNAAKQAEGLETARQVVAAMGHLSQALSQANEVSD